MDESRPWPDDPPENDVPEPNTLPRHRAAPPPETPLWLLERTLDSTSTSVAFTRADSDNPVVWVNAGFTALTGYSRSEVLGHNLRILQGPHTDQRAVRRVNQALTLGGTAATTMLNYRKDGTPFWNRMLIVPLRDDRGAVTHHITVHADASTDVSAEQVEAAPDDLRASLELLTWVIDALSQHMDYYAAADALLQTVVSELADWGFVFLRDENDQLEHVSFATADPDKQPAIDWLAGLDHSWYRSSPPMELVRLTRPSDVLISRQVDAEWVARQSGPAYQALEQLGLGSALTVPLFTRDQPLGALVLEAADPERFTVSSGVTIAQIGRRVGQALDNIRLYRAERAAALTLQHRLAPSIMNSPDLDLAAAYRPSGRHSEVGGDWYDAFPLDEHRTMLAVGDVVGHDMSAAATMGQLSVLLRARATLGGSPSQVFKDLTRALREMQREDVASIACLHWRPTDDGGCHLEYTNLGHPAPLVRLPDGGVYLMPQAHSAPIGVHDPSVEADQDELDLPAGSVVVLYTDGLVERRDRPLRDGLVALADALAEAPDGIAEQIRDHLLDALVHDRPEDDLCLLVVRGRDGGTGLNACRVDVPELLLRIDDLGKVAQGAWTGGSWRSAAAI